MQARIIELYQERVEVDDTVYFLGDLMLEPMDDWVGLFQKLPGEKILIRGNYDRALPIDELEQVFTKVIPEGQGLILDLTNQYKLPAMYLTHYPTAAKAGYLNLVGHVHSRWQVQLNMFNVGLECHHLCPASIEHVQFLYDSICLHCDADVWCASHPANLAHQSRGATTSYLDDLV
jgi:calcineurin-like phosphoesterase family protein